MYPLETEHIQKLAQALRLIGDLIAGLWVPTGVSKTRQIRDDQVEVGGEKTSNTGEVVLVTAKAMNQYQRLTATSLQVGHGGTRNSGYFAVETGTPAFQANTSLCCLMGKYPVQRDPGNDQDKDREQEDIDWVH